MGKAINGYIDMHTVISNERKLGGVIEARKIKLRSGEEYRNPIITNIDFHGSVFYSLCFVDDQGERLMVHVQDISVIDAPTHKRICELTNRFYQNIKTEEKLRYLKRLCEVNAGSLNELFINEASMIVADIGPENIGQDLDLTFLKEEQKIFKIA